MISDKRNIQLIISIFKKKGISDIIISPGSRNAPLILSFANDSYFHCTNIVDERSAAFFALGVAKRKQKPVAICCTSGSAGLNYAPAIVEAYYSKVPVIVLTADRPQEWIDQYDNQTIRQEGIYSNFINKEISLPDLNLQTESDREWYYTRLIDEGVNASLFPVPGPVHFNIPLSEPLYNSVEKADDINFPLTEIKTTSSKCNNGIISELQEKVQKYKKIVLLIGTLSRIENINSLLTTVKNKNIVIISESLSNCINSHPNCPTDLLFKNLSDEQIDLLQPEFLISMGDMVVSKSLKLFLRKHPPQEHWRIDPHHNHIDTYQHLNKIIHTNPIDFIEALAELPFIDDQYNNIWNTHQSKRGENINELINQTPWSDLKAHSIINKAIPKNSISHFGNSSIVRYGLLLNNSIECYANRGTSGIDGSLSTAFGFASASDQLNVLVIGDLSCLYDSNILWASKFPDNLRIIIINNGGGNIFRFIKGPESTHQLENHFEAKHNLDIQKALPEINKYQKVSTEKELDKVLIPFFNTSSESKILEIDTKDSQNEYYWNLLYLLAR
ncbi:MAG: 2-succinyl-5-enolpyruvyl-6-hydroxy-3-cyclohexene-1-carboxylic-acid synthase [Hyphomicrobiales bacterium]